MGDDVTLEALEVKVTCNLTELRSLGEEERNEAIVDLVSSMVREILLAVHGEQVDVPAEDDKWGVL